jgi:hypothetical protein
MPTQISGGGSQVIYPPKPLIIPTRYKLQIVYIIAYDTSADITI